MSHVASARNTLITAWGLFVGLGLLMVGNGLLGVVIGVRAELESFGTATTGVILAAYFAGFLGGTQATPWIMARVGHIRVFAGLTSVVAASALVHGLVVAAIPWMALRLIFGFAMAGLYVVVESWLNELVPNDGRGRVMAVYMLVSVGGLGLGQLLVGVASPLVDTLFVLAGILVVLAIVPVSLSINTAPPFERPSHARYGELWNSAPLGVITAVGSGLANGAIIAMSAVYAAQAGYSTTRIGIFVAAAAVGSMALQWPVGHLSDLIGRRRTILIATLASLGAGAIALMLPADSPWLIADMALLGGFSYPLYSLALSHVIDVLPSGEAVTGSVAVVFLYGVGAVAGPIGASLAMDALGPDGFFWAVAAVHTSIGVFGSYRLVIKPRLPEATTVPYTLVPVRSTFILRRNGGRRGRRSQGDG